MQSAEITDAAAGETLNPPMFIRNIHNIMNEIPKSVATAVKLLVLGRIMQSPAK